MISFASSPPIPGVWLPDFSCFLAVARARWFKEVNDSWKLKHAPNCDSEHLFCQLSMKSQHSSTIFLSSLRRATHVWFASVMLASFKKGSPSILRNRTAEPNSTTLQTWSHLLALAPNEFVFTDISRPTLFDFFSFRDVFSIKKH